MPHFYHNYSTFCVYPRILITFHLLIFIPKICLKRTTNLVDNHALKFSINLLHHVRVIQQIRTSNGFQRFHLGNTSHKNNVFFQALPNLPLPLPFPQFVYNFYWDVKNNILTLFTKTSNNDYDND